MLINSFDKEIKPKYPPKSINKVWNMQETVNLKDIRIVFFKVPKIFRKIKIKKPNKGTPQTQRSFEYLEKIICILTKYYNKSNNLKKQVLHKKKT